MAIMLLAEEYENLFSNTEEYKGDCPLSNQFLIPAVALPVMPPVAVALAFVEGGDLTGILHFNGAFIISLPIYTMTIGCGKQFEVAAALNNDISPSF